MSRISFNLSSMRQCTILLGARRGILGLWPTLRLLGTLISQIMVGLETKFPLTVLPPTLFKPLMVSWRFCEDGLRDHTDWICLLIRLLQVDLAAESRVVAGHFALADPLVQVWTTR